MSQPENKRQAQAPVDPMFLARWSPRAIDSRPVEPEKLESLFEAARWAPSAYNEQPWIFLYASEEDDLKLYRPLFNDMNLSWCAKAPVLGFILVSKNFKHNSKPNAYAGFDAGAAWMSLALQAQKLGLYTHAMAGIHHDKAYETLDVPKDDYQVICGLAIGYMGDSGGLPDPLKAREAPNDRKPLKEVFCAGKFPGA